MNLRRFTIFLCIFLLPFQVARAQGVDTAPSDSTTGELVQQDVKLSLAQKEWAPTPIDLLRGGIFFKGNVAGKEVWVLLDNGAEQTFIDVNLARSLGLKTNDSHGRVRTANGTSIQSVVQNVPFSIPRQLTFQAHMAGVDLSRFSAEIGRPVGVILGREYFNKLAFYVDTENMKIYIRNSGSINPKIGKDVAEISLNDNNSISMNINGKPATVYVDLGNNGALSISQEDWGDYIPVNSNSRSSVAVDASGEKFLTKEVNSVNVEIGTVKGSMPARVSKRKFSGVNGFLGSAFFTRFNSLFDYSAKRIVLIPH